VWNSNCGSKYSGGIVKESKLLSSATLLLIAAMGLALLTPLSMAGTASASNPIKEYSIPTSECSPDGITAGPDGNLWFTEYNSNKIGKVTTSGAFTEYSIPPNPGGGPSDITTGPDGNLWFTEGGNKVDKVTTSGTITEYSIPPNSSGSSGITTGPDGNLWFTEGSGNKIGKVTTSGAFIEYAIPTLGSFPAGITTGPDGNLWFAENGGNKIGKVTTSGAFSEYSVPTSLGFPMRITTGPDGNLWFTENGYQVNKIAKITTSGTITEYSIPTSGSQPYGITAGPDGNLWFTEEVGNQIGRVSTSGSFSEYSVPTSGSKPEGITAGPDGNIWFTESWVSVSKIGTCILGLLPGATYYFAEGTCRPGFDTYFCIQNPGSKAANVTLTYMNGDGTTASDQVTVASYSRATVNPRNTLGTGDDVAHDFSTVVECGAGQQIIAERPVYFDYTRGGTCDWNGGHDVVGATSPDIAFGFAEGTCRPGFDTYFCVQNPGGATADVSLVYLKGDGSAPVEQQITVPSHSRSTVSAKDFLGEADDTAHDFSTVVECTNSQKIIAERPMYFNYGDGYKNWTGGSDVVGSPYVSKDFYFAEGTCRPGFDAYFCIENLNTEVANVTLTYMKGDGTIASDQVAVNPYSRSTVIPRNKLGTGDDATHDFSTAVTSDQPIIAERPIYFNYGGGDNNWNGGHDVLGSMLTAPAFAFAEGTCRPGFDTYFCIQNPGSTTANVSLVYMKGDGSLAGDQTMVPPHSRSTVIPRNKLGTGDDKAHDFSTLIYTTNNTEIIAERPMYFNYCDGGNYNWTGGSDVVGSPGQVTATAGTGLRRPLFSVLRPSAMRVAPANP
jgi:streptogramin lyase